MKRILISLALSVVCLAVTIGSFLTNDIAAYRDWAMTNHPKIADKFDRHFPGFRENIPGQGPSAPVPPDQRKNPFNEMKPPRDGNPPPAPMGPQQGRGPHHSGDHMRQSPAPAPSQNDGTSADNG